MRPEFDQRVLDQRVLVLAPRGRDAAVIAQTLGDRAVHACVSVAELGRRAAEGAGAAIVTPTPATRSARR